mgnify:CR=1 FL=1
MTGSLDTIQNDPRKKIAIVGKAPSSLSLAPYGDDSWQIWTLSDLVLCKQAPRFDVQFELHEPDQLRGPRKPYLDWLLTVTDKPVIVREACPDIPLGIPYPKDRIVAKYGRYFTNTVSWMIALAIDMTPQQIGIWGVDMACSGEYQKQRPSCEFFLGWAKGAGIDVFLPPQCDLIKAAGLYGFDTWQSDMFVKWQVRCKELQGRVNATGEERDNAERQLAYLQGAIEHCNGDGRKPEYQKQAEAAETLRNEKASQYLYLQGALEDCRDYWGQWAEHV